MSKANDVLEGAAGSSPRTVTVGVCQFAPVFGVVETNRERILREVQSAADAGAEIVVLPELATSGYVFAAEHEVRAAAEPVDGPTTRAIREVAADLDVTVVMGLPELGSSDAVYNTAVVVDGTGLRAVYRKVHIWGNEPEMFSPGNDPAPVVDMSWGRLGVLVCYDLEFPEWVRRSALAGADLICAPSNWPDAARPPGERPIDIVGVLAAAATNRMFIAVADRVGEERGTRWVGGSVVAGPEGHPVAMADLTDTEQRLLARCDLATARDKSVGALNDRFADRRVDLYGSA